MVFCCQFMFYLFIERFARLRTDIAERIDAFGLLEFFDSIFGYFAEISGSICIGTASRESAQKGFAQL